MMDNEVESLYPKWVRLGVLFPGFKESEEEPQLEKLIAETAVIGRYEPRLIDCMAGWISKLGDVINVSILHKHLASSDTAVIGLLGDVIESEEGDKIRSLAKYCTPKKEGEMLFHVGNTSRRMKAEAMETATEINHKWNLYYVSLQVKTNAVMTRKAILHRNHNLARRALFGANMRTEILNYLLSNKTSFPAEIARTFGYQHHRMVEEINSLIKDGAVTEREAGKRREVSITPKFAEYLSVVPF